MAHLCGSRDGLLVFSKRYLFVGLDKCTLRDCFVVCPVRQRWYSYLLDPTDLCVKNDEIFNVNWHLQIVFNAQGLQATVVAVDVEQAAGFDQVIMISDLALAQLSDEGRGLLYWRVTGYSCAMTYISPLTDLD